MMRQEINLYTQLRKPKVITALLSWRQFWICNALFIAGLILIYIFLQINIIFLRSSKDSILKKNHHLQNEFYTIKNNFPGLFFSENVAKSVDDLQNELLSGEKFLRSISTQEAISDYLSLFASTILSDTWLTRIKIMDEGDNITLIGKSLSVQSIQKFLEILVNEKKLSGYILSVNNIGAETTNGQPIVFEISMMKKSQ